jgi:hypothetical protein
MPTTEQISTPEIGGTHVVTMMVDPMKYDTCASSRATTEAVVSYEDLKTHDNDSISATSEDQHQKEGSVQRKSSRSPGGDLTAVRIQTYDFRLQEF